MTANAKASYIRCILVVIVKGIHCVAETSEGPVQMRRANFTSEDTSPHDSFCTVELHGCYTLPYAVHSIDGMILPDDVVSGVQINQVSPSMLLPVMPHLMSDLTAKEDAKRLSALALLGHLYAMPNSDIHSDFPELFKEFLRRSKDQKARQPSLLIIGISILELLFVVLTMITGDSSCEDAISSSADLFGSNQCKFIASNAYLAGGGEAEDAGAQCKGHRELLIRSGQGPGEVPALLSTSSMVARHNSWALYSGALLRAR